MIHTHTALQKTETAEPMNPECKPHRTGKIVETYFSNPNQILHLKSGEILLTEGEKNTRIYYVHQGELKGFWKDQDGAEIESFRAKPGSFIGIPSFFSDAHISLHFVVAQEPSVLNYMDEMQTLIAMDAATSLEQQFMPIVINELIHRQIHVQRLAFEHAQTQKILAHQEKMAALGKISAGIAHELNNAIAVIQHSTRWLTDMMTRWFGKDGDRSLFFEKGLNQGRNQSSRQIRSRAAVIQKQYRLEPTAATQLAQLDVSSKMEPQLAQHPDELQVRFEHWETGATLKDMITASEHAAAVVKSVKALGAKSSVRERHVDLNLTLQEAFLLLRIPLRDIHLQHELHPLQPACVNRSELVQVWVNLIQNAMESLTAFNTPEPVITVESYMNADAIVVKISDNGPGIATEILPKIFDPRFTTKSGETTVGLGLGLTFVDRIITAHQGSVHVNSKPGHTTFTITLPVGGQHE